MHSLYRTKSPSKPRITRNLKILQRGHTGCRSVLSKIESKKLRDKMNQNLERKGKFSNKIILMNREEDIAIDKIILTADGGIKIQDDMVFQMKVIRLTQTKVPV